MGHFFIFLEKRLPVFKLASEAKQFAFAQNVLHAPLLQPQHSVGNMDCIRN